MIIHVDMDAFYAAIEERERPELAGLPVIVGADPRGRGVVSTCSYAARRFGIRSAMPIREAFRRCPQGVFLPVRMELYVRASRQVMDILEQFSPLVEPLSIDEAFLDARGCEQLFGPPREMALKIKTRIREETALPCSVGVAPNKFLAKLSTELGKPDGLVVLEPGRVREVLDPLPVERVFGVGKRTGATLATMGIFTVGQIAAAPFDRLVQRLGLAAASHIQRLARGEDDRDVEPNRRPKQMGAERTFAFDLEDPAALRRQLLELAGDVGASLRRHEYRCQSVRLKLRTEDFVTTMRSQQLPSPSSCDRTIYRTVCQLLAAHPPGRPVRLLGVTAADLVYGDEEQQGQLFPPPGDDARAASVERALDRVRQRFGRSALGPASLVSRSGGGRRGRTKGPDE
ncbi:MAG: DNA polymerase IV [Candidatus Riflebacteria bacterium]|nr:DNA polymerase IV [Candidatus Riflebacteria bacterium]